MDLGEGRKLTCCGDEPYNDSEKSYVENSTWLLHEAFCLYSQADIFSPYEKHHSTVKDACELAESMGAANLVLYHTEDRNLGRRKELYTEEGKNYYHGNLYVPEDLEEVARQQPESGAAVARERIRSCRYLALRLPERETVDAETWICGCRRGKL